jgi:hypothetical protein
MKLLCSKCKSELEFTKCLFPEEKDEFEVEFCSFCNFSYEDGYSAGWDDAQQEE